MSISANNDMIIAMIVAVLAMIWIVPPYPSPSRVAESLSVIDGRLRQRLGDGWDTESMALWWGEAHSEVYAGKREWTRKAVVIGKYRKGDRVVAARMVVMIGIDQEN